MVEAQELVGSAYGPFLVHQLPAKRCGYFNGFFQGFRCPPKHRLWLGAAKERMLRDENNNNRLKLRLFGYPEAMPFPDFAELLKREGLKPQRLAATARLAAYLKGRGQLTPPKPSLFGTAESKRYFVTSTSEIVCWQPSVDGMIMEVVALRYQEGGVITRLGWNEVPYNPNMLVVCTATMDSPWRLHFTR